MRSSIHRSIRVIALVAILALVAAACGGGGDEPDPGATDGATDGDGQAAGGTFSTYIGEPQALLTLDDNESEGIAVMKALYTGLVDYDPDTNEPVNTVASSIETEDNQTYTVTLNEGWTFHNGDPVTAESFVRAWNYGAYGPNAQGNSGFFSSIEGFEDVQCGTTTETNDEGEEEEVADCENEPPAAEELSGLEVVNDTEFTITLSEPESFFVTRLGHTSYSPLPEAFYDDPDAFNEEPVGNGPFQMDGAWEHDQMINLTRYEDYAGDNVPNVDGIEFRIYADVQTAVQDLLAGNLDVVDDIPAERFGEVESQLGESNVDTSEDSGITYLGFPWYDEQLGGDENRDLRAALSMAVPREQISEQIFEGLRAPANDLLAPVIPGHQDEVCEAWTTNPERAQELYDQSGGFEGTITVWFNAGAGHEEWIQAISNVWRELGVSDIQFEQQQFAEYLETADTQGFTGPFRLGWGMDYPHPQNYLQFLLASDYHSDAGGYNSSFYVSEEFDAKLAEALSQTTLDEQIPLLQEANEIACNDAALAPVYYTQNLFGWNDPVANLRVDAFGDIVYHEVTVAQ